MICNACQFENPPAARFCAGCGTPLGDRAPVAATIAPEAERRSLCVLFCDLVGSTPLSQRLDPEDLRELVDAYQRVCGDVVIGYDGYVAQYLGDCMVVYFGYPHAHEDDSARVVRCALDMLAAVRRLAMDTRMDLQVRIGVHIGRVVVGTLGGSARTERLAVGETPNIAARVQGEAAPGQIVISESLWRLLGGAFATESLGTRALKGVDQPVGLYRVLAADLPAGPGAARTPFLGRRRERRLVEDVWQRATAGSPRFLLLRGEPGIGKTRLVEVVRGELTAVDTLMARCTPFTTDTALHPFVEMIGLRLGLAGVPEEERVQRLADRLAELVADADEAVPLLAAMLSLRPDPARWLPSDLSPVRARQRTLDLLVEALHAMAAQAPVLLIVEDLHWADPSTLELLRQLVLAPGRVHMLVLLTARPEFKPSWIEATNFTVVELEALDDESAGLLVRKTAHDKPLPPDVLWRILSRAGGNPLFLEEITRSVLESGALVEGPSAWELVGPLAADAVPATMEASLMARIDRLGPARPLLQLAATIGREFSLELLQAVAQLPAGQVVQQMEKIVASGLVHRVEQTVEVYWFKHALVRDAAYDGLLRSTRQRYHERIAQALAERFPATAAGRPELLAHHLSGAGHYARAAVQWLAAGEHAAQRSAVNEAVAHLRRALGDLSALPEDEARLSQELSVLTALAPVQMAVYGWAAAEVTESASRAIALAERLGAHDRLYPPLWALWANQFVGGRLHDAMDTAQRVLAMASATGVPMLEVTGRHATAYTRLYRGEYALSTTEAEAGLKLFDLAAEKQICEIFQLSSSINLLVSRGSSAWMQGRQDEGIATMDEMLALARSLRHPPSIAAALAFQMFFTLYDRDWARMHAFAEECYDLSRAEGFAMWVANSGMHRGRARIGLGQTEAGIAEVLEWSALFRQTGSGIVEGSITSMACEALHLAGRPEEALVVSAEGERRALDGMVRVMAPEIHRTRARVLAALDRRAEAAHELERAVANAREQGALSLELRALTDQLALHLGDAAADGIATELQRALAGMTCDPQRPDLVQAREGLQRAGR